MGSGGKASLLGEFPVETLERISDFFNYPFVQTLHSLL
ncbi:hypothetical protein MPNT_80069 [Candidatus Methylacidithermus pantelleriae]|uniref:Uncharacterized protein n=1 Tax=Candidatus Methylacidithermus pantelleriae TaxID=2744239 RepID=A0A8J2FTJ1_9BACT|nr:hypothetical protein MPNT_80069 [Candidatus Methylacidithermus pantelleriae]